MRRDKAFVWHPYTPMDAYEAQDPFVIARAEGVWLEDVDGKRYIDANSSWWVASLGHRHPRICRALAEKSETLLHCSLAGTTHEDAAFLAEELLALAPPGLDRVFYSDNGSTAVEVALKASVQCWAQLGMPQKTRFVALDGAFHGDTLGVTALGGVDFFRRPFANIIVECARVPFPDEEGYARAFDAIRTLVEREHGSIAAVVVEAIVQGAAGMRMYPPAYLRDLRDLCTKHDVFLVVDEVFSGYGRTGPFFACEHAGITPDFMCIGKAFASVLPMAATLCTKRIEAAFRGGRERAFYYGHTFCGNPLGAALAREVLRIYNDEAVLENVARQSKTIEDAFARIGASGRVKSVRSLGMIGAADLGAGGYEGELGWKVYAEARKRGAYLRPLGDTVYVCPPLVINDAELEELTTVVGDSIEAVLG